MGIILFRKVEPTLYCGSKMWTGKQILFISCFLFLLLLDYGYGKES